LRRGKFSSVPELIDAIELKADHWNDDPRPSVWHTHSADIIAKVRRGWAAQPQLYSKTDH
jgi:hypothetical protein